MASATRATVVDSYMELVNEFPLRRIKTAVDHAKAKKIVLKLSTQAGNRGAADYLDILIDLIADYEKRAALALDTSTVSAAELVRHRIEQRDISISALARLIGIPQSNLSEMLGGKRDWSKTAIRGLSAFLNIRAERFLA